MKHFDITNISLLNSQVKNELKQFTEQHRLTDCLDWIESLTGLDSEASLIILQTIKGGKH